MGAKGIVEIENQLKIILGEDAKQLEKYINDLKWEYLIFFIKINIFSPNSTKTDIYHIV